MEEERRQELREMYSHKSEYNPTLIAARTKLRQDNSNDKIMYMANQKLVKRIEEEGREQVFLDEEERNLSIRQTGKIVYITGAGSTLSVDEYEVKRIIDGKEKISKVYTNNIQMIALGIDQETNKPYNPEYYNAVINGLLSEDMLENVDVNAGFIGTVRQDKEGNYYLTIEKEKLPWEEREMLAAVMMIKEQSKKKEQETR